VKTTYIGTKVGYNGLEHHVAHSHTLSLKGNFAVTLLEKFALISATDGGEDSAARAKLRLMEPAEVAKRACDIAEAAFQEMEARGWLVELDVPTEKDVQRLLGRDI
jgi:hypothetical protein